MVAQAHGFVSHASRSYIGASVQLLGFCSQFCLHPRSRIRDAPAGGRLFVTEDDAILNTYPWLQDFLEAPYPEGFRLLEQSEGWKVFSVTP